MNSFFNHYYRYYNPYIPKPIYKNNKSTNFQEDKEKSSRFYSFGPINFKNPIFTDIEEPVFEIFGIELYLDDIIILGLLFFLYKEGVQDEMLFIILILLLIN